jgi:hypothetical protein
MALHGGKGYDQLLGYFLIGTTSFYKLQHFYLSRGQRLDQKLWRSLCFAGP